MHRVEGNGVFECTAQRRIFFHEKKNTVKRQWRLSCIGYMEGASFFTGKRRVTYENGIGNVRKYGI